MGGQAKAEEAADVLVRDGRDACVRLLALRRGDPLLQIECLEAQISLANVVATTLLLKTAVKLPPAYGTRISGGVGLSRHLRSPSPTPAGAR